MSDEQTHDYFDKFTPHYDPTRFQFAVEFLNHRSKPSDTLIDIGCGDGAILQMVKDQTSIRRLTGLDISRNYLDQTKRTVGCEVVRGSILDERFVQEYENQFDYCTLSAVLHHLIGRTRKESFRYAAACLHNAIRILRPSGYLLLSEPTHAPSAIMDIVFWVKKCVGGLANQRVELFQQWMNLGQPVVSYYTPHQLRCFFASIEDAEIAEEVVILKMRLGAVIRRVDVGIIVQKVEISGR